MMFVAHCSAAVQFKRTPGPLSGFCWISVFRGLSSAGSTGSSGFLAMAGPGKSIMAAFALDSCGALEDDGSGTSPGSSGPTFTGPTAEQVQAMQNVEWPTNPLTVMLLLLRPPG